MRNREKLLVMTWQQRRVLLYALLLLNIIRLALWLFVFGQVRCWLDAVLRAWLCSESTTSVSADFIVWAVSVAGYYAPGGAKCLARALTTQLLLNRYGHKHKLHIGVAKTESQLLEAHAWIEYKGRIIVGKLGDMGRYKSLTAVGAKK